MPKVNDENNYRNTNFSNPNFATSNQKIVEYNLSSFFSECPSYCAICTEDLVEGEIISFCKCGYVFHPGCFFKGLVQLGQSSITECEDCKSTFIFSFYKTFSQIKAINDIWLPNYSTTAEESQINLTLDTNINNLDNYSEMCGLAFKTSPENLAKIINRQSQEKSMQTIVKEDMGRRIALSPIEMTTTPYSGKSRQMSSNQKVEDYIKLQSF
jgi:hypothetical protein